jgi:hypothetical protein
LRLAVGRRGEKRREREEREETKMFHCELRGGGLSDDFEMPENIVSEMVSRT